MNYTLSEDEPDMNLLPIHTLWFIFLFVYSLYEIVEITYFPFIVFDKLFYYQTHSVNTTFILVSDHDDPQIKTHFKI